MSVAAPLVLREGDHPRLEGMVRSSSIRAGLAARARIVLRAAEGLPNVEIARRTGTSRPTVVDWRPRYDAGGIRALQDQLRRTSCLVAAAEDRCSAMRMMRWCRSVVGATGWHD